MIPSPNRRAAALALIALLCAAPARAEPKTVCTVTVNSADEREVFRQALPADGYRFVELAQPGRRDWLGEACRRQVRCDVLVVSGHFAGTAFYSSKHGEHLPVEEMERAACSDSCPGLFSQLKEVYLFGCDTLKAQPVKSATPEIVRALLGAGRSPAEAASVARALSERHGESARDRMRRLFPGVPVIYGFSSLAPYGRVAGPMLRRHFETAGAGHVGTGEPSHALLRLFGPSSMVAVAGQRPSDDDAAYRAEACRYYDDRVTPAQRLAFMHGVLVGEPAAARMAFDRIEAFVAGIDAQRRAEPAFAAALAAMAADGPGRARYLELARATHDPALHVRMVALARSVGWLGEAEERAELATMIGEMLASSAAGYGEVDLICGLNGDGRLDSELARFDVVRLARHPANAAALACLGSRDSRARVLAALTSPDEREVQLAQAYLRHRPLDDGEELGELVRGVARMQPSAAQARALEAVARQPVVHAKAFEELAALFARSPSLGVQRAIAEVFLRVPASGLALPGLAKVLRDRRIKSREGRDVIDALIERLEAG